MHTSLIKERTLVGYLREHNPKLPQNKNKTHVGCVWCSCQFRNNDVDGTEDSSCDCYRPWHTGCCWHRVESAGRKGRRCLTVDKARTRSLITEEKGANRLWFSQLKRSSQHSSFVLECYSNTDSYQPISDKRE